MQNVHLKVKLVLQTWTLETEENEDYGYYNRDSCKIHTEHFQFDRTLVSHSKASLSSRNSRLKLGSRNCNESKTHSQIGQNHEWQDTLLSKFHSLAAQMVNIRWVLVWTNSTYVPKVLSSELEVIDRWTKSRKPHCLPKIPQRPKIQPNQSNQISVNCAGTPGTKDINFECRRSFDSDHHVLGWLQKRQNSFVQQMTLTRRKLDANPTSHEPDHPTAYYPVTEWNRNFNKNANITNANSEMITVTPRFRLLWTNSDCWRVDSLLGVRHLQFCEQVTLEPIVKVDLVKQIERRESNGVIYCKITGGWIVLVETIVHLVAEETLEHLGVKNGHIFSDIQDSLSEDSGSEHLPASFCSRAWRSSGLLEPSTCWTRFTTTGVRFSRNSLNRVRYSCSVHGCKTNHCPFNFVHSISR